MSTTQPPLDLGPLAASYDVIAELTARRGARSFMARRRHDGESVLLTVASPPEGDERSALSQYAADAKSLRNVGHRSLVPILEAEWVGGDAFAIVTDRVGLPTLAERLRRGEELSNPRVALILQQVSALLDWAREQKIVHRAVTPDTLFLEPETDRVLAMFSARPIHIVGRGDLEEDDARTIATLAWSMLARTLDPPPEGDESPARLLGELRPELPRRVLDRTEMLLRRTRDGRLPPDVPAYIGIIAMADAIASGEREIEGLRQQILEEQRVEREQWATERADLIESHDHERAEMERRAHEQERRHVEERETLERQVAAERAEMERTLREERELMSRQRAEAQAEFARARHELEEQVARERAEMEATSAELRAALDSERAELERAVAAEREEMRQTVERTRREAEQLVERTRKEAEDAVARERSALNSAAAAERERFMHERDEALRAIAADREAADARHSEAFRLLTEDRARYESERELRERELSALEERLRNESKTREAHFLSRQQRLAAERERFELELAEERASVDNERQALAARRAELEQQLADAIARAERAERAAQERGAALPVGREPEIAGAAALVAATPIDELMAESDADDEIDRVDDEPPSPPRVRPGVVAAREAVLPDSDALVGDERVLEAGAAAGPTAPETSVRERARVAWSRRPSWAVPVGGAALGAIALASAIAIGTDRSWPAPAVQRPPVVRSAPATSTNGIAASRRPRAVIDSAAGTVGGANVPAGRMPPATVPMPETLMGRFGEPGSDSTRRVRTKPFTSTVAPVSPTSSPAPAGPEPLAEARPTATTTVPSAETRQSESVPRPSPVERDSPVPPTSSAGPAVAPPTQSAPRRSDGGTSPFVFAPFLPQTAPAPRLARPDSAAPRDTAAKARPDSTARPDGPRR